MTIEPPEAKKIPSPRTFHGDTVVDEYAWLAHKDDPDTIDYLRAENEYTDELTAHLASLRDQIFEEIKARTQESDLSVPVRKGSWWHYSRTVEGKQYAVHCRRAVRPGEVNPPIPADGQPLDGEEELLDGNELAVGHEFFSLGAFRTSPDQRWLAYSTDFAGNERFTLRIKDLATGPGSRCRTRSRTPTPAAPGPWTALPCSTRPWTRPGGRTGSGGTGSARKPPRTPSSSRSRMSASTSG